MRTLPTSVAPPSERAPAFAGGEPVVRRLCEQLASAAALRCPVLITGEPGAGRTRAARWLHAQAQPRPAFVVLRGLPPEPGDEHGPATLFVPQLDEAPLAVQAEWRAWLALAPPGVRLIASARGAWPREGADPALFAALRRFALAVPPLRERRNDLAAIAADLAGEIAREHGAPPISLTAGALNALRRAPWIASARDLRHALERLASSAPEGEPASASLADEVLDGLRPTVAGLRERELARERDALLAALQECHGNLARTARRLGRSRAAVYRLIAKHGIALGRSG